MVVTAGFRFNGGGEILRVRGLADRFSMPAFVEGEGDLDVNADCNGERYFNLKR